MSNDIESCLKVKSTKANVSHLSDEYLLRGNLIGQETLNILFKVKMHDEHVDQKYIRRRQSLTPIILHMIILQRSGI